MRYIDVRSDLLHPGREVEVPQIQYEDQVVQVPIQKQAQFGERGLTFFVVLAIAKRLVDVFLFAIIPVVSKIP